MEFIRPLTILLCYVQKLSKFILFFFQNIHLDNV